MGDFIEGGGNVNYNPKASKDFMRPVWREGRGLWRFWPLVWRIWPIGGVTVTVKDIEVVDRMPVKDGVDLVELACNSNQHAVGIEMIQRLSKFPDSVIDLNVKFSHKKDAVMFKMGAP